MAEDLAQNTDALRLSLGLSVFVAKSNIIRFFFFIMKVRLTQLDGKLPNLALMKLSHFHKSQGDEVYFEKSINRGVFEPKYDSVLASAIFSTSQKKIEAFKQQFPQAIIGGTGTEDLKFTVENLIGENEYENYDYTIYPKFEHSIGFSQRGCRLRCKFCVVPQKEGKINLSKSVYDIWRGDGYPKKIHLLDNDFFGDADWKAKITEMIDGNFEICINQGINIRLINDDQAHYLAKLKYKDDQFKTKRIYTAWDNLRDEPIFTKGVNTMINAGIKPNHILVYFLCGYWEKETFEDVYERFSKIKEMGMIPYPMIYGENPLLKKFQRWVVTRLHQFVKWEDYQKITYAAKKEQTLSFSFSSE